MKRTEAAYDWSSLSTSSIRSGSSSASIPGKWDVEIQFTASKTLPQFFFFIVHTIVNIRNCVICVCTAESQSNHSGHSDSGVDTTSSQGRSQSVVSSIFSEAWKRGTQIEENTKV